MFIISTARPGEAWHTLQPIERLGHKCPHIGFDYELEIAVRRDPGNADGEYTFRYMLCDSFQGSRLEAITDEEYDELRRTCFENGDDAGAARLDERFTVFSAKSSLMKWADDLRDRFLAMVKLDLFRLPINI